MRKQANFLSSTFSYIEVDRVFFLDFLTWLLIHFIRNQQKEKCANRRNVILGEKCVNYKRSL